MQVAKIIRHRHRLEHYLNEVIRKVEEDVHYKILFSDPEEKKRWDAWLEQNGGKYEWNKDQDKVTEDSNLPELKEFEGQDICFCDVFTHYTLNIAGYSFHSTLNPFKGEVYVRDEVVNTYIENGYNGTAQY